LYNSLSRLVCASARWAVHARDSIPPAISEELIKKSNKMVQRKKMEEIENENNDMAIGYASQQNPSSCY